MKNLLVKPAGSALVPDFEALEGGVLRFIGRKHDPSIGKNGGWVPVSEPVSVPYRSEYVQELKAGALLPANEETAKAAGLQFNKKAESKDKA
jgi:hypothetical protein